MKRLPGSRDKWKDGVRANLLNIFGLPRVENSAGYFGIRHDMERAKTKDRQTTTGTPSESLQSALVTLLADDDPGVWEPIRQRLIDGGAGTLKWLRAHRLHRDPVARRRVREVMEWLGRHAAEGAWDAFLSRQGEALDLEEGAWLFVRTRYPDAPVEAYQAQLDEWAGRLREQMACASNGEQILERINRLLFGELGFRGNEESYYDPANSYLNLVMDRRTGIPITLGIVYLLVSKRLSLPVTGIGMPGHFLCRYQTPREEHYIDAFHGGRLLTRAECVRRLRQFAIEPDESSLQPLGPRRILHRMVSNLHLLHKDRRDPPEAERLQRYLALLGR